MLSRYFASAPAYRFFHTPMHRRDRRKRLSEKLMATLLKKGGAYFSLAEDSRNLGFGHRSRRGHAATASDSYYLGLVAQLPLVLIVLPSLLVLLRVATHRANLQHDNVEATAMRWN